MKKGKMYNSLLTRKSKCEIRIKKIGADIINANNALSEVEHLESTAAVRKIRRHAKDKIALKTAALYRENDILNKIEKDLSQYN